jgi:hypothetical protein
VGNEDAKVQVHDELVVVQPGVVELDGSVEGLGEEVGQLLQQAVRDDLAVVVGYVRPRPGVQERRDDRWVACSDRQVERCVACGINVGLFVTN